MKKVPERWQGAVVPAREHRQIGGFQFWAVGAFCTRV